ncbi:MAG: aminoglycoside phosphotransferase family protein [Maribacter dokdonensis]
MLLEKLKFAFSKFQHNSEFKLYQELASGHINSTYLIITESKPNFVLQCINDNVFNDVQGLILNKFNISTHLKEKLKDLSKDELYSSVLTFIETKEGKPYYRAKDGSCWNLMNYIDDSITFETVDDKEVAYEAGKLFGGFLNLTYDYDATKLIDVIPEFHDMFFRFSQFQKAIKASSKERLAKSQECIDFAFELKEEMHIIQNLKESGKINVRVTHNDTKISNALFSKSNKGLCVIDTDTVMPGIVHYDFGDAIRTICNEAAEDETNLDLVEFNMEYYKAYEKGFLEKIRTTLTSLELQYLPLGAKTMMFIMGLRFLTDYLNNDVYYKIKYAEHNLDRAKNQFKLVQSFSKKMNQL